MSKSKYWLELTRAELEDLLIILKDCQRDGWHYGRKDYWDKHLKHIISEATNAYQQANIDEGRV